MKQLVLFKSIFEHPPNPIVDLSSAGHRKGAYTMWSFLVSEDCRLLLSGFFRGWIAGSSPGTAVHGDAVPGTAVHGEEVMERDIPLAKQSGGSPEGCSLIRQSCQDWVSGHTQPPSVEVDNLTTTSHPKSGDQSTLRTSPPTT